MEGVFVEDADSGVEVGVQAEGRVGSAVVRILRGELAMLSFWNSLA